MKRIVLFISVFVFLIQPAFSQKDYLQETDKEKTKRMQWWLDDTYGLFIHWGIYAVPAGEYKGKITGAAEWIMGNEKIPVNEYEKFAAEFNPQKFDAKEWVRIAKNGGMKYIVITSKHHDGFSIWDSEVSDYDVMDATPFKRDILKELSDACKEAGIDFGFYHSIMDWHHPDANLANGEPNKKANPDWEKYREEFLKPQLVELIEKYDPKIMWFDGEWIPEWTEEQGKNLYNYLRNIKPSLIINNRIGKGRDGMQGMNKYESAAGDFGTPEKEILNTVSQDYWETCMTMNDTWGFKEADHNWKSTKTLINQLIDAAAKGGNYLLNVGPTAEGIIPKESVERLEEIGRWLKVNGEAIYSTNSLKKYKEGDHIRFTQSKNGKFVYAIIDELNGKEVRTSSIAPKDNSKIYMLGSDKPLLWKKEGDVIVVQLPATIPTKYACVLKFNIF